MNNRFSCLSSNNSIKQVSTNVSTTNSTNVYIPKFKLEQKNNTQTVISSNSSNSSNVFLKQQKVNKNDIENSNSTPKPNGFLIVTNKNKKHVPNPSGFLKSKHVSTHNDKDSQLNPFIKNNDQIKHDVIPIKDDMNYSNLIDLAVQNKTKSKKTKKNKSIKQHSNTDICESKEEFPSLFSSKPTKKEKKDKKDKKDKKVKRDKKDKKDKKDKNKHENKDKTNDDDNTNVDISYNSMLLSNIDKFQESQTIIKSKPKTKSKKIVKKPVTQQKYYDSESEMSEDEDAFEECGIYDDYNDYDHVEEEDEYSYGKHDKYDVYKDFYRYD